MQHGRIWTMRAATTIFIGAFIAFAIQPLAGRTLLPEFGGMASVWVTCLAAFQVLLIAGYWYADRVGKPRNGGIGKLGRHIALLVIAAAWLAVAGWKHVEIAQWLAKCGNPAIGTLFAVLVLVGVPFVLLSANSSLVQLLAGGEYRLYAVSNLGSFAGLLAYPFVLEPWVSVTAQWWLMAAGMAAYAGMLWGLGEHSSPISTRVVNAAGAANVAEGANAAEATCKMGVKETLPWLAIPAATCFLLNATTAHLTSALTPIPLMWVYVLSLYLLTYVVGFTERGAWLTPLWMALGLGSAVLAVHAMSLTGTGDVRFAWNFVACTVLLLFAGTGLHSWLYRLRPEKEKLTRYYLCIALGGGAGGIVSGMICPMVFKSALEYPIAIVATMALMVAGIGRIGRAQLGHLHWRGDASGRGTDRQACVRWRIGLAIAIMAAGWYVLHQHFKTRTHVSMEGRTFYGTWCVSDEKIVNQYGKRYPVYAFTHGGTTHGLQPKDDVYRHEPTSYFGPLGGGLAFSTNPRYAAGKPVRAAVIGLGIGTLAMYGRDGDVFRFYEICPEVLKLAEEGPFDYLRECKAKREMVLGDARKRLEEEDRRGDEKYDIIAIDVFSGDSISMYFVSQEAFALYRRRLKADGTFAMHITNWNIDLMPVMKAAAKALGMKCSIACQPQGLFTYTARWALMYNEEPKFPEGTWLVKMDEIKDVNLPTDEKGSLVPYLMVWR